MRGLGPLPNTTYGHARINPYKGSRESRLRNDRAYGLHVNAVLVEMPTDDGEPYVEMMVGFGTTLKQARSEARAYAARAGYKVHT